MVLVEVTNLWEHRNNTCYVNPSLITYIEHNGSDTWTLHFGDFDNYRYHIVINRSDLKKVNEAGNIEYV